MRKKSNNDTLLCGGLRAAPKLLMCTGRCQGRLVNEAVPGWGLSYPRAPYAGTHGVCPITMTRLYYRSESWLRQHVETMGLAGKITRRAMASG